MYMFIRNYINMFSPNLDSYKIKTGQAKCLARFVVQSLFLFHFFNDNGCFRDKRGNSSNGRKLRGNECANDAKI